MEEELKKNIEMQVDVVLKMEEERLLLIKENKELKEGNKVLKYDNEDLKEKMEIFERELNELQEQIKNQRSKEDEGGFESDIQS